MSNTAPTNLPRHATHRYHTFLVVLGVLLAGIGTLAAAHPFVSDIQAAGLVILGLLCTALGVAFAAAGILGRRLGQGVQVVNTSFELIGRGRFAEAERLLDHAEKEHALGLVLRVAAVQRGLIAMRRGKIDEALVALDRGIEGKVSIFYRSQSQLQATNARGIRAFLRAASGDRKGARADIEAVRGSPDALPQALARAALAEAILTERAGDRDVLREHLTQHHELLFDVTDRRERAIVRAFQRMLEATTTSVYRKGAKRDAEAEEPPLADWIAQVVPQAAPFVETNTIKERTGELPDATTATPSAKKAVEDARKAAAKSSPKPASRNPRVVLGLWAVLVAVGVAVRMFLASSEVDSAVELAEDVEATDPTLVFAGMVVAIFTAAVAVGVVRRGSARKEARRLFAALSAMAKGDVESAQGELEKLTQSRYGTIAAQAHLALATKAERDGDLPGSLRHVDQGLGRLSQYASRISASDILLPDLVSQRAFVLAAMDRLDEAEAELASLPPVYPFKSRALFRVRLVARARQGDLAGAAALAAEAGLDLPLSARDELLADVVRAATSPETTGAVEIARIKRELRTYEPLERWLEKTAPKALAALRRTSEETHVDTTAAAEHEALAEAEVMQEAARLRA